MDLTKEEWRVYVKVRCALGCTSKDIHADLQIVGGDHAPAYSTVVDWAARFRAGRQSLKMTTAKGVQRLRVLLGKLLPLEQLWMKIRTFQLKSLL